MKRKTNRIHVVIKAKFRDADKFVSAFEGKICQLRNLAIAVAAESSSFERFESAMRRIMDSITNWKLPTSLIKGVPLTIIFAQIEAESSRGIASPC